MKAKNPKNTGPIWVIKKKEGAETNRPLTMVLEMATKIRQVFTKRCRLIR